MLLEKVRFEITTASSVFTSVSIVYLKSTEVVHGWSLQAHCLDIIRQQLMCSIDVGVLGQVWWNQDAPEAYVDFNTKHTCKNFEEIRKWAEAHQLPAEVPFDFLQPPKAGDTVYETIPWTAKLIARDKREPLLLIIYYVKYYAWFHRCPVPSLESLLLQTSFLPHKSPYNGRLRTVLVRLRRAILAIRIISKIVTWDRSSSNYRWDTVTKTTFPFFTTPLACTLSIASRPFSRGQTDSTHPPKCPSSTILLIFSSSSLLGLTTKKWQLTCAGSQFVLMLCSMSVP